MEDQALLDCVGVLPREMRTLLLAGEMNRTRHWEEIRLRAGRGLFILENGLESPVLKAGKPVEVTQQDLRTVLEMATQSSYQSVSEQLRQGFLTLRGGHRIGVAGTVVRRDERVDAIRELSSLTIRIARSFAGAAQALEGELLEGERFPSTLILSPPGMGKTTLLREMLRLLSDRFGLRVSVADERSEIAALWRGKPQFDVGKHTDVMDGCPKAEGMLMLLRSMNPQILAADEITAPEDIEAISQAANCGVSVLATAHGGGMEELRRRPLYRRLLEQNVFRRVCLIWRREDGGRDYTLEDLPC